VAQLVGAGRCAARTCMPGRPCAAPAACLAGAGRVTLRRAPAAQEGLANVCLVGASTTLVKAKVEASMPRKRGAAAAGYDKALASFFDKARPRPPRLAGAGAVPAPFW